ELLNRIKTSTVSEAEIASQLPTFFSASVQEQVREGWFKRLINIAQSKGFSGLALIDRVGGMHNAGEADYASGFAKGTVAEYQKELPKSQQKCRESKKTTGICVGKFIKPVFNAPITSEFGWRIHPIKGTRKHHDGVDFGAPLGTPVRAADGGKVIFTGWMGGYGNTIDIQHCDGTKTRYAHLSKILTRQGKSLSQGQVIGNVGSTGFSTGPHLHFEVHVGDGAVNPRKYLPK
ncbi:MAG: M23 family metallopeptidase, partial [Microcystaceae cyanobacterium]